MYKVRDLVSKTRQKPSLNVKTPPTIFNKKTVKWHHCSSTRLGHGYIQGEGLEARSEGRGLCLTIVVLTVAATEPAVALAVVVVWSGDALAVCHAGLCQTLVLGATCEHACV